MKYYITFGINGTYTAEVEAEFLEEAIVRAKDDLSGANTGDIEVIGEDIIAIVDENDTEIL